MKIGITFSAFDLLHAGHILMLEEAKSKCDYLIAYLQSDPTIDRPDTKNKPIQSVEERRIQLNAVKHVDLVMTYDTEADLIKTLELLKTSTEQVGDELIRILGVEYKGKPFTGHDLGIECYFNSRDHDYSTTELRNRIKNS